MYDPDMHVWRNNTVERFQNWLLATDAQEPQILFFYDEPAEDNKKGGIGKSWLLQQCKEKLAEYPDIASVTVDFFSIRDRSGVEIARRVIAALQRLFPGWQAGEFQCTVEKIEQATRGAGTDAGLPSRRILRQALLNDLATLPKLPDKQRKRLVIFCDTYERVQMHPAQVSLSAEHLFPDFYDYPWIGFVIAGRDKPDEGLFNWRGRTVTTVPVGSFTREEMLLYIQKHLEPDSLLPRIKNQIGQLFERTGNGRPILVGLLIYAFNRHVVELDKLLAEPQAKFEESLVLYLDRLDGPVTWAVIFMAHVYHRFNQDILDTLLSQHNLWPDPSIPAETRLNGVWQELTALPSVRRPFIGDEIVLHDEMRRLVLEWNRREKRLDAQILRDLSKTMIEYYDKLLKQTVDRPLSQAYKVERLYHQCYLDLNTGFAIFLQNVQQALKQHQNIYARSLIQEMDEFKASLSAEQLFHLKMQDARLLQNEEHAEKALSIYEELDKQADDLPLQDEERASLFCEWGICLTTLSRFAAAIYLLTNALEIYAHLENESKIALISVRLGFAYRKQGNLDTAKRYYRLSLEMYRVQENAVGFTDCLNALGELFLFQGKYERALVRCTVALQRRQELFAQQKPSAQQETTRRGIAFVQSDMGKIYFALRNIEQAESYFRQAYDNYEAESYQEGIAVSCYYFGQLALEKKQLDDACSWFKQACTRAGSYYPDIEIMSLHRWGLACALQQRTEEALRLLRQASELANNLEDFYQQAHVLLHLAAVLLQDFPFERLLPGLAQGESTGVTTEQLEEAEKALEQAESLAKDHNYYQLHGWIMKIRGDGFFRTRDYAQAFLSYVEYSYYMAKYNHEEYNIARRYTLVEAWLSLPKEIKREMHKQIKDDWDLRDLPESVHILMKQDLERMQEFMDL